MWTFIIGFAAGQFVLFLFFLFINLWFKQGKQQGFTSQYDQKPPKVKLTPKKTFQELSLTVEARSALWPFLNSFHSNKLDVTDGPDKYSVTVIDENDRILAHFWPKSQWWNLIGNPTKGHGLEKLLGVLKGKVNG